MVAPLANDPRGLGRRGADDAVATDVDRAIEPPGRYAGAREQVRLDGRTSAIVDEAILRGASIDEVMQVLFALALAQITADPPASRYRSAMGVVPAQDSDARITGTDLQPALAQGYRSTRRRHCFTLIAGLGAEAHGR